MVKLTGQASDAFFKNLDHNIRAVLFYGPDEGQVRERASKLSKSICPDSDDPFRIADIAPANLKDDPARLGDECAAIAFGGERRVVRISGLGEQQAGPIVKYVADPFGEAMLIVTAGNLTPKSKLRSTFESSKVAVSVACYPLAGNQLKNALRESFENQKVRINTDALDLLSSLLAEDAACMHAEVEKLCLYSQDSDGPITAEDVQASCGDQSAHTTFELAYAVADGAHKQVQGICDRLLISGENPVAIVRGLSRHFDRLLQARGAMDQGNNADAAMKSLRPPVFFKDVAIFKRQLNVWSSKTLLMAITRLLDIEKSCKTTGSPAAILLQRGLLEIASLAARQRQRR